MLRWILLAAALAAGAVPVGTTNGQEVEKVGTPSSGVQIGSRLVPWKMRASIGPSTGKVIDLVERVGDAPAVLIFLRDLDRQSIAIARLVSRYAAAHRSDGLCAAVILLTDDVPKGDAALKRIQHALIPSVPTGVSLEGKTGPEAFGLDGQAAVTILVAKDQKVVACYAIERSDVATHVPPVIASIAELIEAAPLDLQDLLKQEPAMLRSDGEVRVSSGKPAIPAEPAQNLAIDASLQLRPWIRRLTQTDASDEQVEQAAKAIADLSEKNQAIRDEVRRIASNLVRSGKLESVGNQRSRELFLQWADAEGSSETAPKKSSDESDSP